MSASPPASVAAASRDALCASASTSVAPITASSATAATPSAAPRVDDLAAVKQRIAHVAGEITVVEKEIAEAKTLRDACPVGSELRQEHTAELQRLGRKEDRLREEKSQLRDELKRKELALDQPSITGQLRIERVCFQPRKFAERHGCDVTHVCLLRLVWCVCVSV